MSLGPDTIMSAYLDELARHESGGIASVSLFRDVAVSKCCGVSTYSRNGKTLCLQCRQPCELKWLEATRTSIGRHSGTELRVRESRVLRVGASDDARVDAVERWLLLSRIVEPIPPNVPGRRWAFALKAWEACLHAKLRKVEGAIERFGNAYWWHLGAWTETRVDEAVREARDIVRRRSEPCERELCRVLGLRRAS